MIRPLATTPAPTPAANLAAAEGLATGSWANGYTPTAPGLATPVPQATVIYTSSDPTHVPGFGGFGPVTESTALQMPAVWAAVNWRASTLASFPKQVFRKTAGTRQREHDHPLAYLLNDEPNPLNTPQVFWETLFSHADVWGNGYALLGHDDAGRVATMHNLPPDRVVPFRSAAGEQWYALDVPGVPKPVPVPARNILHICGLGYDGQRGYPVVQVLAAALGIGRSAQAYTSEYFRSGGIVGGSVEADADLKPDQLADLRLQINQGHQGGLSTAHRWMVLAGGLKAKPFQADPKNAQLIEVVNQHTNDVCRIFGVPPFVVQEYGRATWANIESQNLQAVQFSLLPWIIRAEQEIGRKCFTTGERRAGYFVAMNVDALIRGNHTQQIESAGKRLMAGLTTPDEERALMDLPPYPDGIGARPRVAANTLPLPTTAETEAANAPAVPATGVVSPEPVQVQAAAPAVPLETFRPLLADAADRVGTKTEKATTTARNKFAADPVGWTAWSNVFANEQARFARDAVGPVLATIAAVTGQPVPDAAKVGEVYAGRLRGHFARLAKGEDTTAPDLEGITNERIERGDDEHDQI